MISTIEVALSTTKANLSESLTAIYKGFSIVFATINTTNLQEKSNASPRESSINRIILNSCISHLLKEINPLDNLAE
jgi:hypothetical protein